MPSYLTSTTLITSVQRRAYIPESQVTFDDTDFLAIINEEMKFGIVPSVLKFHEEFFVNTHITPLVANQSAYAIPDRTIGNKLRAIYYQDGSGTLREMARIQPEDLIRYQQMVGQNRYFYLENNSVVLVPSNVIPVGNLVFKFFQRPNELVDKTQVSTILAIDRTTGYITVDKVPSTFTTSSLYDFLETRGAHKCRAIDVPIANITKTVSPVSYVLQFTDIPADLVAGDTICLAGTCFIPQIPDELHVLLAQRTAVRILESQGDVNNLNVANAKLAQMEAALGILIDSRVDGSPKKAVNLRSSLRQTPRF